MGPDELIVAITARLHDNPLRAGLFLGGSRGRGTADAWSDIDFITVLEEADHPAMVTAWRAALDAIAPIVFWNQIDGAGIVLNAITATWIRIDLSIQDRAGFVARRARNLVRPLIDTDELYDALPASLPDRQPNPDAVRFAINEFIRIIGLTPVAFGRGEYVTAVRGTGLLHNLLTDLLQQHVTLPDPGGALHLSSLLPPEQMAMLAALPYPGPERGELLIAQTALARTFFPLARQLATQLQIEWPAAFEQATLAHLRNTLGSDAISW